MSLGSNIRNKRAYKSLSQEILAEKLHISQATLSNIEANKSIPDINLLLQISVILETSVYDLLDGKAVLVNNNNQNGGVGYAEVVNQLSEKLIKLYETQLSEKDALIIELKRKLSRFE